MQELIIIRGLPGSGKSTFAKRWIALNDSAWREANLNDERIPAWLHFETDMYFVKNGVYLFDPQKLTEAHSWCLRSVTAALKIGHSVIVSNTFTRIWEMQPYIDLSREFNCRLTVLTVEGDHGNVHNVPDQSIQKMKDRWEKYEA